MLGFFDMSLNLLIFSFMIFCMVRESFLTKRKNIQALAGVAQWIERWPVNQRVPVRIRSGRVPGLWARARVRECGRQPTGVSHSHQCSLLLFLPPFCGL